MAKATPESEQLVQEFLNIVNTREYAKLPDVLAESYVMIDPAAPEGEVHGPAGMERWLRQIVAGFPDFEIQTLDSLASETVVMVELQYIGTHEGEFNGIPPTGRSIELEGMEKYRVTDGKLQWTRVYFHDQEMKNQLGLSFPEVLSQLPKLARGKIQNM